MVQVVNPLENAVVLLQDFGFFSVILPFVLVYALIYGLLNTVGIFGSEDDAKTVNQIIALSVGAFVITSTDAVNNIMGIIPQAGFFLVVSLMLLMILGLFGIKTPNDQIFSNSWAKGFGAITITGLFLLIIDMGVEGGIPLVRPFSEFLVGQSGAITGAGFESLIALTLLLGFPIAVIYFLSK
ncbi:hypothetical protein CMO95_00365 [Candidatus Woesearchaeota archaeon]|nr:hypothetical protein [Candidatus Woesearchaeota archaeon]